MRAIWRGVHEPSRFSSIEGRKNEMSSSGYAPTLTTRLIQADGQHPAHPAINEPGDLPYTLLTTPDVDPPGYGLTFTNPACDQQVQVFIMAFQSLQPNSPTWSNMSVVLPPNSISFGQGLGILKSDLGGADTLWIGAWWNGIYSTTQAYFADHPAGGGHHTVPITVG
jgi:hypothetical protein